MSTDDVPGIEMTDEQREAFVCVRAGQLCREKPLQVAAKRFLDAVRAFRKDMPAASVKLAAGVLVDAAVQDWLKSEGFTLD